VKLLRFRGRVARAGFWWKTIAASLVFIVLFVFLESEVSRKSTLALYPFYFYFVAALAVARMRDRGRSPWWLAAVLIPVLGPLWLAIELGLRRGTQGENQYGRDPLEVGADYLTVDIGQA